MLVDLVQYYNEAVRFKSDPRVENLFLMGSLSPTLLLCGFYMLGVYFVGPVLMKNKKPYNLQNVLTIYNISQVVLSGYIFYESLAMGWLTDISIFRCQSVDYAENPKSRREIMVIYMYFLSKFTEFLDTVFFILRKKNSQVTFLHVYHHVSMPIYIWTVTKFYPGGSMTIIALLNSFIHVIMYMYYLLAGLGPHMQKYLWWKRYLTVLQLIQFLTGVMHFSIILFSNRESCNISKRFITIYIAVGMFFFLLFNNFYKKVYKKQKPDMNSATITKNNNFKNGESKKVM